MTTEPTTQRAFAKRAEQWNDRAPLFATLCRTIAEAPDLATPVVDGPDDSGRRHTPVWRRPHHMFALVTRTLRTEGSGHALAEYWPTLGGKRPIDDALDDTFGDFCHRYADELTDLAATYPMPRQNEPLTAVMLWPGIAWAAADAAGPVALLELGSAAGMCLYPDKYGYRYGERSFRGDSALVLECGFGGEVPDFLGGDVDVAARVGLENQPIRRGDSDAVAWLRDCVFPDLTGELDRIDKALSIIEDDGIDWWAGDFMETLPNALSDVPAGVIPIIFGAHTLCCVEDAGRLPTILEDSGRDLVWIAKEHADNALGLVSDAASDYAAEDGRPPTVLLTAVTYRAGRPVDVRVLAEPGQWNSSLNWSPHSVPVRRERNLER